MVKRTLAGLGLTGFWPLGDDTWKPENDENLQILSVIAHREVLSRVTDVPGAPTVGDVYIVPASATGAWAGQDGKIAVNGYNPTTEAQEWVFIDEPAGPFYVADEDLWVETDGTSWVQFRGAKVSSLNAQGGNYTLVLGDGTGYSTIQMTSGSANTLTIPTNASVAFPVGTLIAGVQTGEGVTTIAGDTGVTVNGVSAGSADANAQYSTWTLLKIATDSWVLSGSVTDVT